MSYMSETLFPTCSKVLFFWFVRSLLICSCSVVFFTWTHNFVEISPPLQICFLYSELIKVLLYMRAFTKWSNFHKMRFSCWFSQVIFFFKFAWNSEQNRENQTLFSWDVINVQICLMLINFRPIYHTFLWCNMV